MIDSHVSELMILFLSCVIYSLILFIGILLVVIFDINKKRKLLQRDAIRYREIKSWHFYNSHYVVGRVADMKMESMAYSGERLTELVDSQIQTKKLQT